MLKIYTIPISLYSAKLRILLRHKRLVWEEALPPGGYGSDEYKKIVASGNLPALVDNGLLLADSEAIAEYLNEVHPDPPMLPADPVERAKIRELSRFHDTRLEPELRVLFTYLDLSKREPAVFAAQSKAIDARLKQLARMLDAGDRVFGRELTLADCGYAATFTWLDLLKPLMVLDFEWPEAVTAYRQRSSRLDAIAEELASYRPRLEAWLAEQNAK